MAKAPTRIAEDVTPVIPRAVALGIASGMRAWPPLAALALSYKSAPEQASWRQWPMFRSEVGRAVLLGLGATELVTDKMEGTQARIALDLQLSRVDLGLLGRIAAAGIAGAAIGSEHGGKDSVAAGAALAIATSIFTNYAGYFARTAGVEKAGIPDAAVSLAEDVATITLLAAAVSRSSNDGEMRSSSAR